MRSNIYDNMKRGQSQTIEGRGQCTQIGEGLKEIDIGFCSVKERRGVIFYTSPFFIDAPHMFQEKRVSIKGNPLRR